MLERGAAAVLALAVATGTAAGGTPLPTGFGPVTLGTPWGELTANVGLSELNRPTSDWERLVRACGYHSAELALDGGRLLITAQDSRVTALSYATALEPGSDLMQVAELVISTYGQPRQATLRDAYGTITIDPSRASHVVLEYEGAVLEYEGQVKARFAVSGAPLWEYRISVEDGDARRLENLTLRCARERGKDSRAPGNGAS